MKRREKRERESVFLMCSAVEASSVLFVCACLFCMFVDFLMANKGLVRDPLCAGSTLLMHE